MRRGKIRKYLDYRTGKKMDNKVNIPFRAMVNVGDYAIGVSASFNGIFKLDYEECKIEYIGSVPGENVFGGLLYCEAILNGMEVILIPFRAECIAILNLKTMEFSKHQLPRTQFHQDWKFSTVCRYKNKLFLIPGKYENILSFDMDTHEIEKVVAWKTLLEENFVNEDMLLAAGVVGVYESTAYIQVMYTNILLVLDMERGVIEDKVYLPKGSYTVATVHKENVWIVPSNKGSVVRVSVDDLSVEVLCDSPLRIENGAPYTSVRVMCKEDKLFMFPQGAYGIGIVDLKEGTSSVNYAITEQLKEKYGEYPSFFFVKEYIDNHLFVSLRYKKSDIYSNVLISLKDMKVEEICFVGNDEWKKSYLLEYVEDNKYTMYTEKVLEKVQVENPLEIYVEYLKSANEVEIIMQTESIGKAIHEFIKRQ